MKTRLFLFTLFLSLFSCSTSEDQFGKEKNETGLPEKGNELRINWIDGGGMLDLRTEIFISNDSCSWSYRKNGREKHIPFQLSEKELNQLYGLFVKNKFHLIKSRSEGEIYDRGGVEISLNVDGTSYRQNNSGSYFIEDEWKQNWENVSTAITSLTNRKLDEKKFPCHVLIDPSISDGSYPFQLGLDDGAILKKAEVELTEKQKEDGFMVKMLEGPTEVQLHLYYPDSLNQYGGKVTYLWMTDGVHFTPENNTATFYLEGEQLLIK